MHRHPHQRRRENARNVIAHWFDQPPPAERGRRRDLGFHLEPDVVTEHGEVTWQQDPEFIGANRAERACIGIGVRSSGRSRRPRRHRLGIIRTAPPPGANRPRRRADIRRREGRSRARLRQALALLTPWGLALGLRSKRFENRV